MDKMFKVISLDPFDDKKAKIIEAIVNRPQFTNRVIAAMEEYIHKFVLPEILFGTPIDPTEVDKFMDDVTKENADGLNAK